jgi:hypothetical protein
MHNHLVEPGVEGRKVTSQVGALSNLFNYTSMHEFPSNVLVLFYGVGFSPSMVVKILEVYEGTLEEDSPNNNERYEHNENVSLGGEYVESFKYPCSICLQLQLE